MTTGPKQIGDKGYQSGSYRTPPKANARTPDPRWKAEYATARKITESTFSVLISAGLQWGLVKTKPSLRRKVALAVLAHDLKFRAIDSPP